MPSYDVSLTFPDMDAETPEAAATAFVQAIRDGGLGNLHFRLRDEDNKAVSVTIDTDRSTDADTRTHYHPYRSTND